MISLQYTHGTWAHKQTHIHSPYTFIRLLGSIEHSYGGELASAYDNHQVTSHYNALASHIKPNMSDSRIFMLCVYKYTPKTSKKKKIISIYILVTCCSKTCFLNNALIVYEVYDKQYTIESLYMQAYININIYICERNECALMLTIEEFQLTFIQIDTKKVIGSVMMMRGYSFIFFLFNLLFACLCLAYMRALYLYFWFDDFFFSSFFFLSISITIIIVIAVEFRSFYFFCFCWAIFVHLISYLEYVCYKSASRRN